MIFGRPETFAIEVSALGAGPSGVDPVCAATWTALGLVVNDRNLFRNIRRGSESVSGALNWPAIYFARWLVHSWGQIYHTSAWPKPGTSRNARDVALALDEELADNYDVPDSLVDARDEFVQAHSLRSASAGAAMPDAWLSRDGDVVSLAWDDSSDGDIYFPISRGEADVPAADFAEATKGFVGWVRDLLVDAEIAEAAPDIELFDNWLGLYESPAGARAALVAETGLADERLEDLRKLAGVATDAELFDLPDAWFQQGTLADVRESPIAVAFRCVAPVVDEADLVRIRRTFVSAVRDSSSFEKLNELASTVPPPLRNLQDYVRGYRLARALRTRLGNEAHPLDIEALISKLGIHVTDLPLSDRAIDGGCVCDDRHGPAIFVNPMSARAASAWGRRVVLAHELCHLLFDRRHGRHIGMLSGPWAPPRVERIANAFAIEFLLPLQGIVETVGPIWDHPTDEHINALMKRYELSLTAVSEHVRNMRRRRNR